MKKTVLTLGSVVLLVTILPGCFVKQAIQAHYGKASTVAIQVKNEKGDPIRGVTLRFKETGYRTVLPTAWRWWWTVEHNVEPLSSSADGSLQMEFHERQIVLDSLLLNGVRIPPKSLTKSHSVPYYRTYTQEYWRDVVVDQNSGLVVKKAYHPNSGELLGHRVEIVIFNADKLPNQAL